MRTIDRARSAPMTMLKALSRRRPWRTCWAAAPNASHMKQLGTAASRKRPPREAACKAGLPASTLRKVDAALALTSHDFGLTHWKTRAPRYPTGCFAGVASMRREDVAIFHDSQSRTAAPPQLRALSSRGYSRTRLPRPSGTRNIMRPMPVATPKRQGSPPRTPECAPAAGSMMLLGPGVTAATTAKRRKAAICSVVIPDLHALGRPLGGSFMDAADAS